MKKLLVGVVFLSIVNFVLLVLMYGDCRLDIDGFVLPSKCDTSVNKVRIDSIEYIIRIKDSIVNRIKYNEKEYNKLSDERREIFNEMLKDALINKKYLSTNIVELEFKKRGI